MTLAVPEHLEVLRAVHRHSDGVVQEMILLPLQHYLSVSFKFVTQGKRFRQPKIIGNGWRKVMVTVKTNLDGL